MLYPFHHWELDLVSLAEGKLPLPGTGPLITRDMWPPKLSCLRPSDLRNRHKAKVTGVNRAISGAGRARMGQLREVVSRSLEERLLPIATPGEREVIPPPHVQKGKQSRTTRQV